MKSLTLDCKIKILSDKKSRLDGVVERLAVIPSFILGFTVTQGGVSGDQSQDALAFIRPRIFNPGMTDDVGTYSCLASISILDVFFGGSISEALQIQSMFTFMSISSMLNAIFYQFFLLNSLSLSLPPILLHCMRAL